MCNTRILKIPTCDSFSSDGTNMTADH